MRLPLSAQEENPWLVRELARDFTLDEVWEFPIAGDARKGETFRTFCQIEDDGLLARVPGPASWLMNLRLWLGKLAGLDRHTNELPIPGCTETSVWHRMKPEERQPMVPPRGRLPFRVVYDRETERLMELSNGTVHALVHLGWARKTDTLSAPRLAVYVKPRGRLGKLYMAVIYPFRVFIVYPALMRVAKRRWESRRLA